jgi:predicted permease
MLLAALGAVAGVLLAEWALSVVIAFGADLIPRVAEISLNLSALGFAVIATLVTGLLIGLLPAMQASAVNVLDALKDAGRGAIGSGRRLRSSLLIVEVALSLVLLIAAGLITFYEQVYERLATLPGATSAALSNRVPLTGDQAPTVVAVAGRPIPALSQRAVANRHLVSPHYFSTLRIPLRAGRDFDERDNARVPHVVIINETFARRQFPSEDPIGRRLITGMAQTPSQVVGVVADIRGENLDRPPEPEYFLPLLQRPEMPINVLVRTSLPPAAIVPIVRAALRTIDPDLPLLQPDALATRIGHAVAPRKLALMLLGGFAALALVLASLGVYSVMAHLVAFRTNEIGLRMALGASSSVVMRMVLGQARRLTLVGIAFGIAGALVVSRLMQQALFEVNPMDPLVYIALSVTLLLVAEAASFFPARRATRIDPVIALRTE